MTRVELLTFLPATLLESFVPPCYMGARSYAEPTTKWLTGPCYAAFKARYFDAYLAKWQYRWECRDFAAAFRLFAVECWATSTELTTLDNDDGISVGEMWYKPTPDTAHAICPIITNEGLLYLEPQNGQLCTLTSEQYSSRFFLRF